MGTGATVSNPHGWKQGEPVQSAEGCLYPTWERVEVMEQDEREKTRRMVLFVIPEGLPDPCPPELTKTIDALRSFFADKFATTTQDALDDIMARMK